jgi:phage gpG-like protein
MITGQVTGSAQVIERLRSITPNIRSALEQKIQRLTIQLQRKVVADKLQGQVLNVKTGRLQRSINQAMVTSQDSVMGVVSTNVVYAKPHEYGFHGTVTVKQHLRMITQAFGKELKEPVQVTVSAHTMTMNLPERSFLRSALADMRGEIQQGINDAVKQGLGI